LVCFRFQPQVGVLPWFIAYRDKKVVFVRFFVHRFSQDLPETLPWVYINYSSELPSAPDSTSGWVLGCVSALCIMQNLAGTHYPVVIKLALCSPLCVIPSGPRDSLWYLPQQIMFNAEEVPPEEVWFHMDVIRSVESFIMVFLHSYTILVFKLFTT
jgi:hypothetical protein